jgi:hypothetical protein
VGNFLRTQFFCPEWAPFSAEAWSFTQAKDKADVFRLIVAGISMETVDIP